MPRIWVLKCFLSHLNCLLLWNNCSCKHQKLLTFHSRFVETIPLHSFNIQVLILQTKLFCRRFGFTSRRNFLLINDVQVSFSLSIVYIHDEFFIPKFVIYLLMKHSWDLRADTTKANTSSTENYQSTERALTINDSVHVGWSSQEENYFF